MRLAYLFTVLTHVFVLDTLQIVQFFLEQLKSKLAMINYQNPGDMNAVTSTYAANLILYRREVFMLTPYCDWS